MFLKRRQIAIEAVSAFVAERGGGRLSCGAAKRYGEGKFDIAWRLWMEWSGTSREFHILADENFPYSWPHIALPDVEVLAWPHVEEDGRLCLLPPDATASAENPVDVVRCLLVEAQNLVKESVMRSNVDDFRQEFLSYWCIAAGSSLTFTSLVEPRGPSRSIHIFRGKHTMVVGDCREDLVAWLRRKALTDSAGPPIEEGYLLWLPQPLLPSEYPHTAADVRRLVEKHDDAGRQALGDHLVQLPARFYVLLGAATTHGVCFGAISIRKPERSGFGKPREAMTRGFRPGHLHKSVLLNRYFPPTAEVAKHSVRRADHRWIHGRDRDDRQDALRSAKVAVLGCGSLGAAVGRMLAQSGVGSLLLVDPELMDWSNVGRHVLGAPSTLKNKADELASHVRQHFPHLRRVSSFPSRIGPAASDVVEELRSCDLIVNVTANWSGEGFLNDLQRSGTKFPPIVYGWLEAHALAAHAVVIRQNGACLRCGVDDLGIRNFAAIEWPNEGDVLQTPACGGTFSPYGPAELCWAQALVTETTLDVLLKPPTWKNHRIWIGQTHRVRQAGGIWTTELTNAVGDIRNGGFTFERPWLASPSCPVCERHQQ